MKSLIKKYIDEKRMSSAFALYFFSIGLYGFNVGFPLSTYVVFGLAYLHFLMKIIDTLMLESGPMNVKFVAIDKGYFLIVFVCMIMLLVVAKDWQVVICFYLVSFFFIFIKNIAVLFILKF